MKIKIKVTHEILKRSMMCGTNNAIIAKNCAIALAVREILPKAAVTTQYIFTNETLEYVIPLPAVAQIFIGKFDRLKSTPEKRLLMPELEFEVTLNEDVLNSINIEQAIKAIQESKTLELV
jgi:hypothetical protein